MHRTLDITVPSYATDDLLKALDHLDTVVGLSVQRGASIKPKGDVIVAHVLNRGADDVLRLVGRVSPDISVVTAETSSIIDPLHDAEIADDVDEAIWEEVETGLRHQGRVTPNYLALMALGGTIGAVGMVSEGVPQALAFVAASILSPGYEPIAKVALGLALGRAKVIRRGLTSAAAGYAVFILTAGLAFLLLRAFGAATLTDFLKNTELAHLASPGAKEVLFSVVGALAGAVIMASFRRSVIAGALVALVLMPAAASLGMALSIGRFDLAGESLERLALDVTLVIGLGWVVFWLKQHTVHRRKPLV